MTDDLLLDPSQPVHQAAETRRLLEDGRDYGPDGSQVIARGWTWQSNPTIIVAITTDNRR